MHLYVWSCSLCLSVCLFVCPIITQQITGPICLKFWLGNWCEPRECSGRLGKFTGMFLAWFWDSKLSGFNCESLVAQVYISSRRLLALGIKLWFFLEYPMLPVEFQKNYPPYPPAYTHRVPLKCQPIWFSH